MKLEDIVVSLDLAKELKEHGYSQETLFYWTESVDGIATVEHFNSLKYFEDNHIFAAPTASEMGERLPNSLSDWVLAYSFMQLHTLDGGWDVEYYSFDHRTSKHREVESTEANARAKMWLHLKKKNLLKEQQS